VNGIDIVEIASPTERAIEELAEKMAQAILTAPAGYLTQSQLWTVAGGHSDTQRDALDRLAEDDRVRMQVEKVRSEKGRVNNAKVWRPAEDRLL
jgi:hypothetical protein